MTIGVGVEGASEWTFWKKVLHKNFGGIRFDVRNLKNKEKLIRATPQLTKDAVEEAVRKELCAQQNRFCTDDGAAV